MKSLSIFKISIICNFLFCIALILIPINSSFAEYKRPASTTRVATKIESNLESVPLGTYKYEVSWQGIGVADATIKIVPFDSKVSNKFKPNPSLLNGLTSRAEFEKIEFNPDILVHVTAITNGVVALFYSLKHDSYSWINKKLSSPTNFSSIQKENSKTKQETIGFGKGSLAYRRWKRGDKKDEDVFKYEGGIYDPISGFLNALAIKEIEVGKKYKYKIFTGKHIFFITFFVEKEEVLKVDGKNINAYKIVPEVEKLTDTKGEDKLKSATLWVSKGAQRKVLKVSSDVWLGSIDANLISFSAFK